jgi:hypothetical protein
MEYSSVQSLYEPAFRRNAAPPSSRSKIIQDIYEKVTKFIATTVITSNPLYQMVTSFSISLLSTTLQHSDCVYMNILAGTTYLKEGRTHLCMVHFNFVVSNSYYMIKGKSYPCKTPFRPVGLWDFEDPPLSRQSAEIWCRSCQPYAPAALCLPKDY